MNPFSIQGGVTPWPVPELGRGFLLFVVTLVALAVGAVTQAFADPKCSNFLT